MITFLCRRPTVTTIHALAESMHRQADAEGMLP